MSLPRPLQIYKYENEKYRIDLTLLCSVLNKVGNRRVAVYSINGPLRSGKSFILNIFLKYLFSKGSGDWINDKLESNFTFQGGSKRETTGIFMWSEPFIIMKEGEEIALLLLDTQGCFDSDTTMQENAIVFSLSTLLSSYIMFNIKEQVSEDMLQFLQYFTGFSRLNDEENKDDPFQKLIFLIRDWQRPDYDYGHYDDHNYIDGKNFKKDFLNVHESQPNEVKFVHEMILSTFTDVGVYLMPHPGRQVARHSNTDPNSFNLDFYDHLKKFTLLMFSPENIVEKRIGGNYVTGSEMRLYVEKWAKIFESKEMPQSKSVFQVTAELQNEMAKQTAINSYVMKMKELVNAEDDSGLEEDLLEEMHSYFFNESIQLYKSFHKIGSKEYENVYTALISDEINGQYPYFVQLNNDYLHIKEIRETSELLSSELTRETEEYRSMLMILEEENEAEKLELLRKIEQNTRNLRSIEDRYAEEIRQLRNNISSLRRELNAT